MMIKFDTPAGRRSRLPAVRNIPARNILARSVLAGSVTVFIGAVAAGPALAAESVAPPNFAPTAATGWLAQDDEYISPPSGPGPIVSDPAHPYISFYKSPRNPHPTFRVADLRNPILQPWTRERLEKVNERSLSGEVVAIPKERCWPVGVPAFDILPATPVYFLQTPKEVVMIWMQDHWPRHVYLDVPHSANPKPSWFGESVGHYEGDTLVVDTIALNDRTFVDNYQTPHTDKLHVIERFRMVDGGKTMEVKIHVEDPGAFTTPWDAIQHYRRVETAPMIEISCPENNDDHFHHGLEPMPHADKATF
jgi:hypothetical protein